jgi:hypothetical protein
MHEINFIDESFDQHADGICSISIQANQNGLTYCLTDDKSGSYVLFRKHRFENVHLTGDLIEKIAEVLEKDETLNHNFNTVRFLGYTQQSTLVPDAFFDRNKMVEYLAFNYAGDIDHEIYSNFITPLGLHNVLALPRELVSLIALHFRKVEFMNQTTPFLSNIANHHDSLIKPSVYVGLNPGFFDVACTGEGKLKLYNTFQYANECDLLYYVVFVCNQMGFDTRHIPLYLSGELSARLSHYDILKLYIPETKYDEIVGIPSLAPGLKQLRAVGFLNLLNLQMCASSAEHTGAER